MAMRTVRELGAALLLAAACAAAAAQGGADPHARAMGAFHRGDVVTAMSVLRPAADRGDAKSQVLLAYISERSGQDQEAYRYYSMAADAGNSDAEVGLAELLLSGRGAPRDPQRARALYERAAAKGNGTALKALEPAVPGSAR